METMFREAYIQGIKDNSEGIHICPKQLYQNFLKENDNLFVNK